IPANGARWVTAQQVRDGTDAAIAVTAAPKEGADIMTSQTQRQALISDGLPSQLLDLDPAETREWLESLDAVVEHAGPSRARYLMLSVLQRARERQVGVPGLHSTDY